MQREVFRSTFNRVLSVLALTALGVLVAGSIFAGAVGVAPGIVLGAVGAAALVWAILWAPHVAVDDEAVIVANVLTEHRVPWAALIHVETRYALVLHTPGKKVSATGAPAPGALGAVRSARVQRRSDSAADRGVRPADLPSTDSGRAAELVRNRWDALRDAGRIEVGIADATPVTTRVRAASVVAIVLGVAAMVGAALLA